jgi:hypothetical protein
MTFRMEERLWITARHLAREADMEYTVPCAAIIRDFIRAGTHNMIREKRTGDHDFEEADANLGRLVRSMIDEARILPNTRPSLPGPTLVREGAFVKAKTLAPLWPFC